MRVKRNRTLWTWCFFRPRLESRRFSSYSTLWRVEKGTYSPAHGRTCGTVGGVVTGWIGSSRCVRGIYSFDSVTGFPSSFLSFWPINTWPIVLLGTFIDFNRKFLSGKIVIEGFLTRVTERMCVGIRQSPSTLSYASRVHDTDLNN